MKKISLIIFLLFIVFNSCQSNLTFDNIEIDTNTTLAIPLISFDVNQNRFYDFNTNTEVTQISDTTRYELFQEKIIRDNITRFGLSLELNNQFDRDFFVEIVFLDSLNVRTHAFNTFRVEAGDSNFTTDRSVFISDVPEFINTSKFVVNLDLRPGANAIDPNVQQTLGFKSQGTYFLSF